MTAIVVLGMHRSGTSCLAGMLAAGGLASAGDAVRNWDNARGHFEMLDAVRLNEAVLAHSDGHWLSAPAAVRWTSEHADTRDRLLAARVDPDRELAARIDPHAVREQAARVDPHRSLAARIDPIADRELAARVDPHRSLAARIDPLAVREIAARVDLHADREIAARVDPHADREIAARVAPRMARGRAARIAPRPSLIKDPRTLLALPFWRASSVPFHSIAIVRHPLAVARSLESWRGTPIDDGIALWIAHNRVLLADRAHHAYPIIDFDAPRDVMIASVIAAARSFRDIDKRLRSLDDIDERTRSLDHFDERDHAADIDEAALAAAHEDHLVHHDGNELAGARILEAMELHAQLVAFARDTAASSRGLVAAPRHETATHGTVSARRTESGRTGRAGPDAPVGHERRAYPRALVIAFTQHLGRGDVAGAMAAAREALAVIVDASAVLVPVVTALVRQRAYADAIALITENAARLDDGLADLLQGKVLLARDPAAAVMHLEAACAVERPLHQARHLLPQALRAIGRHADARAALERVAGEALYAHGPLATLAEWSWLDGEHGRALGEMARAIESAPPHRRGRLRTRRAEWLLKQGDADAARAELEHAIAEDPAYERSRAVLRTVPPPDQTSR